MKSCAAAKASLFIKNRCRSNRSQMFFKIDVLKNFATYTGKHFESLFNKVEGLQVFSCEYCKTVKSGFFYRTTPVAASANVLFYLKRSC